MGMMGDENLTSENELPDDLYGEISDFCEKGNVLADQEKFAEAYEQFDKALALVPVPRERWEASTWIFAALGDMAFSLKNYPLARQHLDWAVFCPDGLGNPFIHLRLGQVNFELSRLDIAADELIRAYMGDGETVFEQENPKYFDFLKTRVRI